MENKKESKYKDIMGICGSQYHLHQDKIKIEKRIMFTLNSLFSLLTWIRRQTDSK